MPSPVSLRKLLLSLCVGVFGVSSLAGCGVANAQQKVDQAVVLEGEGFFGKTWVWRDSNGSLKSMSKCSDGERRMVSYCVETSDGKVHFEWLEWNRKVKMPTLEVDGKKKRVECENKLLGDFECAVV